MFGYTCLGPSQTALATACLLAFLRSTGLRRILWTSLLSMWLKTLCHSSSRFCCYFSFIFFHLAWQTRRHGLANIVVVITYILSLPFHLLVFFSQHPTVTEVANRWRTSPVNAGKLIWTEQTFIVFSWEDMAGKNVTSSDMCTYATILIAAGTNKSKASVDIQEHCFLKHYPCKTCQQLFQQQASVIA